MTGEQPNASHANGDEELKEDDEPLSAAQSGLHTFLERSRYIPLRLSADERRYLHLLEAAQPLQIRRCLCRHACSCCQIELNALSAQNYLGRCAV